MHVAPPRALTTVAKNRTGEGAEGLPIKMLHDRLLVSVEGEHGERRSGGGILIPATASVGRRLDPEERAEVELGAKAYILLRERDLHAIAARRVQGEGHTGLYL